MEQDILQHFQHMMDDLYFAEERWHPARSDGALRQDQSEICELLARHRAYPDHANPLIPLFSDMYKNGYARELDETILLKAAAHIERNTRFSDPNTLYSVNLSLASLGDPEFWKRAKPVIEKLQRRILIEILEGPLPKGHENFHLPPSVLPEQGVSGFFMDDCDPEDPDLSARVDLSHRLFGEWGIFGRKIDGAVFMRNPRDTRQLAESFARADYPVVIESVKRDTFPETTELPFVRIQGRELDGLARRNGREAPPRYSAQNFHLRH